MKIKRTISICLDLMVFTIKTFHEIYLNNIHNSNSCLFYFVLGPQDYFVIENTKVNLQINIDII